MPMTTAVDDADPSSRMVGTEHCGEDARGRIFLASLVGHPG